MLIRNQQEMQSFIILYGELHRHLEQNMSRVYLHERIKDSYILHNEAIPLPNNETFIAWRKLFRGYAPFPLIQIPQHAMISSAINPAVYGFHPDSIQIPGSSLHVLYSSLGGYNDERFPVPTVHVLHLLATSGFYLFSMSPTYQAGLLPTPRIKGAEHFIGMMFIFTNAELSQAWQNAYDEILVGKRFTTL